MGKISFEDAMKENRLQNYRDIADYDEIIELGIETKWKTLSLQVSPPDDPTDVFDVELDKLQQMRYSMKLMNICCLCETWEQDLYNYLKEKSLIAAKSNEYRITKQALETAYPTCKISNYNKIIEMRALVNAIKHGEGPAFDNLQAMTDGSILADSHLGAIDENGNEAFFKQIKFDKNTLTSKTLKVDGKLQEYCDEIIKFWRDVYVAEKVRQAEPENE